MGGSSVVERQKTLGSDWTLLEWSIFSGFSITMHTEGVQMRKDTAWIGYSETTASSISISWWQTIPWGGIQAKGRPGQSVSYSYHP